MGRVDIDRCFSDRPCWNDVDHENPLGNTVLTDWPRAEIGDWVMGESWAVKLAQHDGREQDVGQRRLLQILGALSRRPSSPR